MDIPPFSKSCVAQGGRVQSCTTQRNNGGEAAAVSLPLSLRDERPGRWVRLLVGLWYVLRLTGLCYSICDVSLLKLWLHLHRHSYRFLCSFLYSFLCEKDFGGNIVEDVLGGYLMDAQVCC